MSTTFEILTRRQKYEILRSQLDTERSSFMSHWKELGEFILPRRPRWSLSDTNRGDKKNQRIIDSTATLSARTLSAGMMGGITSPARPWFRLTTTDRELAQVGAVKVWLDEATKRTAEIFLGSNLYNALPLVYGDIGTFATGAMMVEEDFEDVIRCYTFPIGSYMIANNDKLKVDVFFREFRMTVRQLIEKFGKLGPDNLPDWSNFSELVKSAWLAGERETWVDVCHVIQPNDDYDPNKMQAKYKRYSSCYYERGSSSKSSGNYMDNAKDGKMLRESGYDFFPVLCPRWTVNGEDVYGTDSPGMAALGDIKQLQLGEKRSMQAIEKMVNPPMTGPSILRSVRTSIVAGDITYLDAREGQQGFRPVHEVDPRIQELEGKQDQVRQRIRRAFFEDLFLMLAQSDRRQITAREIDERHEEKLLAVGPVLEQLNQDLLDPLIDITFEIAMRQGRMPEPPEELQGQKLKIEYVSVMAQAQKLVGIAGIERFAGFINNVMAATKDPAVLDKVDVDEMIDVYGDATGIAPQIIRPDEDVAAIRAERQKAAQAQQATEMVPAGAKAAKDLSQTDTGGDNALTRLLRSAKAGQVTPEQ